MLKRTTLLMLVLLIGAMQLFATQVPLEQAATIAKDVFTRNAKKTTKNLQQVRVVSKFIQQTAGVPDYYIFNLQPTGFVIISADDRYNPILAFSEESHIDFDNDAINIGLMGTLSKHEQRIKYLRKNNIKASAVVQTEWQKLRSGSATRSSRSNVQVGPLTTTLWDQGELYNAVCPADETTAADGPDGRTYCGCVPIAMAQLIKFHNYPAQGNGSNEYEDNNFGTQSADFCNTEYNWDNMPDALTEPNADVSNLIYQMGVASFTQYSTEYTETYFSYVRDAYVNYFGYDQAANWFLDADYDQFAVVAKQDLDRGLPLLLTGTASNLVGHTWVTDGYGYFSDSDKAEYFHFNWGWGGSNNGWFLDSGSSWLPLEGQGDGVNEITYYWDRWVLHNLYPAGQTCQTPPTSEVSVNGISNGYAWLNQHNFYLDQEISFRYRESGTTNWITTDVIEEKNYLLSNLKPGTEYEYQGRRKCCGSGWSGYTETQTFVSSGERAGPDPTESPDPEEEEGPDPTESTCDVIPTSDLTTSSIGDHNAYIYSTQPYGQVNNQFRYRVVGTTDWTTSSTSTTYYRYLSDLLVGTQYEFQVRHECTANDWSDYSAAQTFTTTGTAVDGGNDGGNDGTEEDDTNASCDSGINGNNLYTSSISDSGAYLYTPQPNGAVNNQFRFRPTGTSTWTTTNKASTYYRYLSGLLSGTTYEFQVSQQCSDGTYSSFSSSQTFTTTGTAVGSGNNDGNTDGGNTDGGNGGTDGGNTDCDLNISGTSLTTSSTSSSATYVYTPQPIGAVNNLFRYRRAGTSTWSYSNIASTYYRYLTGLTAGTTYEFQVQHQCEASVWSEYSGSAFFTTTSSFQSEGPANKPHDYATFQRLAIAQTPTKIQVYPNPVQGVFEFSANHDFEAGATLNIYNTQGKQLKSISLSTGQQRQRINIEGFNAGIYLVQYQTATTSQTLKFIKE